MNTPTDKEVRDWYMGYGVPHRAELAEVEGEAFDRYLLERDAKVAKATEERIIKLLEDEVKHLRQISQSIRLDPFMSREDWEDPDIGADYIGYFIEKLIKGEQK